VEKDEERERREEGGEEGEGRVRPPNEILPMPLIGSNAFN